MFYKKPENTKRKMQPYTLAKVVLYTHSGSYEVFPPLLHILIHRVDHPTH